MKPLVLPVTFIVMVVLFIVTLTHKGFVRAVSEKHTGAVSVVRATVPNPAKPSHRIKSSVTAKDDMGLASTPGTHEDTLPLDTRYLAAQDVRNVSVATGDTGYTSGEETEKKKQKMGYTSAGTLENAAGASSTVTIPPSAGNNGQNPY